MLKPKTSEDIWGAKNLFKYDPCPLVLDLSPNGSQGRTRNTLLKGQGKPVPAKPPCDLIGDEPRQGNGAVASSEY